MKRVAEIKARREAQFYKNRQVNQDSISSARALLIVRRVHSVQDYDGPREESQITDSEEAHHCQERCGLRTFHTTPTADRVSLAGEGKNQGPRIFIKKEDCHDTRRRAIYGDGSGLIRLALLLFVALVCPCIPITSDIVCCSYYSLIESRQYHSHKQNSMWDVLYSCRSLQSKTQNTCRKVYTDFTTSCTLHQYYPAHRGPMILADRATSC